MDKKLILKVGEFKINKKSEVSNSLEDLEKTLNKLPKILDYFEIIDIKSLIINGNKFIILFSKDNIYIDNKLINLSAKPTFFGNTIVLDLYSLYLKDYDVLLDGKIKVNVKAHKINIFSNYLYKNISGHLNIEANENNINILINTKQLKDIKFLKEFFRLNNIAEAWMYDNVVGSFKLNNLFLSINAKTLKPNLKSIAGDATITKAKVVFNKELPAVRSEKINVFYKKDVLSIYLNKAEYLNKNLDASSVIISNLSNKKGIVDVNIKSTSLLDQDILNLLEVYKISLPLKQISGETRSDLHLRIPYASDKKIDVKGLFVTKSSILKIKEFEFFAKEANVILDNELVHIKDAKVKLNTLLQAKLDLSINTTTLLASGDALIEKLKINAGENESLITIKDFKTKVDVNLNDIVKITLQDLKTDIMLNKNSTDINIQDLSLIQKYSDLMQNLNATKGSLNLKIKNEKDISFTSRVFGLDFPIKIKKQKPVFYELNGRYLNKNLTLYAQNKKIKVLINENKTPEIFLKDLDFLLYEKNTNKNIDDLELSLNFQNVVLYVEKDERYNLENINAKVKKKDIYFDGSLNNLNFPLQKNGKKLTKLLLKGSFINNNLIIQSDDKNINFKLKQLKDLELELNNIDVLYYTKDKYDDNTLRNVLIKGKNSNIFINDTKKVMSKSFKYEKKDNTTIINSYFKNTSFYYKEDKNKKIKIKASNLNDEFINNIFNKKMVKKGMYNIDASGVGKKISGTVLIDNSTIQNMAAINNIITLVNTSPALLNPLLAIPSVFNLVTQKGFDVNGYKVVKGTINFTYDFEKEFLDMEEFNTKGNSVDFEGKITMNFKNDEIKGDVFVIFMKSYSKLVKYIPLVNYVFLGEDKRVDTEVNISGQIDDPKIHTNLTKDSASVPFNILKRILLLPLKAVESILPDEKKPTEVIKK